MYIASSIKCDTESDLRWGWFRVWERDYPHVINLQLVTVVLMNIDVVLREQVQKSFHRILFLTLSV